MKAVKGNKVYTIGEAQQKSYQGMGFDILDDDGNIIAYGKGKTVPYEEYAAVRKELEELKSASAHEDTVETPEAAEPEAAEPEAAEPEKKSAGKATKKAGE